jgi:MtfA peptidase
MTAEFLDLKSFDGAAGFEVSAAVCARIALKACVPILNLGLDYYAGWSDIVIYPGEFRVQDEYTDDAGVVHRETRELCGQSLNQGPMVLSWATIEEERTCPDRDVVIHECTHKLDILNGAPNGFPPLHTDMSAEQWAGAFKPAFERFTEAVDAGTDTALDPYAATDPAEFFSVMSETFFTLPAVVRQDFPAVYAELTRFYRQDPYALLGEPT